MFQHVSTIPSNAKHPATLRTVASRMDESLQKGGAARKFAVSLEGLEYSGDLAKQLFAFSSKMERTYQILQDMLKKKESDPAAYAKYFHMLDEKIAWFNKAEASHWGLSVNIAYLQNLDSEEIVKLKSHSKNSIIPSCSKYMFFNSYHCGYMCATKLTGCSEGIEEWSRHQEEQKRQRKEVQEG